MFYQFLAWILGTPFSYHPTNVDSIVGNFNSPLDGKLLVFGDEIFWGGNKAHSGVIKKLISRRTRDSNAKYGRYLE